MKRWASFVAALCAVTVLFGCVPAKPTANGEESETAPPPKPVQVESVKTHATYGKRTGTDKTYTGREPLSRITLDVPDPDNRRGLSETSCSHSFGVAKDGKPNAISVDNQKIYEDYGGYCLGPTEDNAVYLTFDCGYENGFTGPILDTLKEKRVPAAFFVTMDYLKSAPELTARMINEGHVVGNHSTTHPDFSAIPRTEMVKEIETVDNELREHFGYSSAYFRFPAGNYSESALELVQSIGYTSVFWSSAYADWDPNAQKGADYALKTVTARLHPGCVLLLHAVSKDNAEALGAIIDEARAQGYVFRPLP